MTSMRKGLNHFLQKFELLYLGQAAIKFRSLVHNYYVFHSKLEQKSDLKSKICL